MSHSTHPTVPNPRSDALGVRVVTATASHTVNTDPQDRATRPLTVPAPTQVAVWDLFVRLFHWILVLGVVVLWVSAQYGWQEIHMPLGLGVAGLITARLIWGFVGSAHARFASFAVSPFAALNYLADIARGRPAHYLGHNPAGAWMVFVLLGTLFVLTGSGIILQATLEFEGPLVDMLRFVDDRALHEIIVAHKLAITLLYLLIPAHVVGVVLASIQHRENLVGAMFSGRKKVAPQLASRPAVRPPTAPQE